MENDALRLHLKLALDSIKNPIEVPKSTRSSFHGGDRKSSLLGDEGRERGFGGEGDGEDKENDDVTEVPEREYSDDDESIDVHEERANEVQGYMKDLLKDLGLFRRKIGDDKHRFVRGANPLRERSSNY